MALKFLNDGFFDGKVGIGTNTPDATLEPVNISATSDGDGSASDTLSGQDSILLSTKAGTFEETSGSITWRNGARRRAMITGVNESVSGDGDILGLAFYTQGTDGAGDFFESMRIAHSGKVGIGTTSPIDLLALHNNATGAVDAQMNFTTAATGQAVGDGFRVGWNGTVAQMYLFENADMRIATNNIERIRILSGGNVGIGETDPQSKLQVDGGISVGDGTTRSEIKPPTSGNANMTFAANAGNANTAVSEFIFTNSLDGSSTRNESMRIDSAGNVGIGTTNPSAQLQVVQIAAANTATFENITQTQSVVTIKTAEVLNNASALTFSVGDNLASTDIFAQIKGKVVNNGGTLKGDLIFNTNQGDDVEERMRILSNGNVGIGTNNPFARLDVKAPGSNIAGEIIVGGLIDTDTDDVAFGKLNFANINSANTQTNDILASISGEKPDSSNRGELVFSTSNETAPVERMRIDKDGAINFNAYGAGTLVTDASGNITASSGGGAGGPYLPVANPTFTGELTGPSADLEFIKLTSANPGVHLKETDTTDKNWDIQVNGGNLKFYEVNDARSVFNELVTFEAGGNVGIGRTNPSRLLEVNGVQGWSASETEMAALNPATNGVDFFFKDASGNVMIRLDGRPDANSFFNSGGNVGIGTSSPLSNLHIETTNSSAYLQLRRNFTGSKGRLFLGSESAANIIASQGDAVTDAKPLVFQIAEAEKMRIDDTGNVGIGETNPNALLHVRAATDVTGTIEVQGGKATVTEAGEVNSELNFGSNDASATGGIGGSIKSVTENTNGAYVGMSFYTAKQGRTPVLEEAMRIDHDGKVGVGTNNPNFKLDITETTTETNTLKDVLRLSHITSGTAASGLGAGILFSAERALNGFNLSRGAIYGVSGPNGDNDGDLLFHTRTDTGVDSATAGMNEKMRITHNGLVGIGTNNPNETLHVNSAERNVVANFESTDAKAYISFKDSATTNTDTVFLGAEGDNMAFYVGNASSQRMRISSAGDVSINGTSNSAEDTNNGVPRFQVNTTTAVLGEFPLAARFTTNSDAGDNSGVSVLINSGNDRGLMISAGRQVGNTAKASLNIVGNGGGEIETITLLQRNVAGTTADVGIGTTIPAAKLHVKDDTATAVTLLQLESTYNSPSGNKSIHWSDETDNVGRISVDYSNPMGKMRFGSIYNSTYQTADVMVLQGDGKVGIGDTSPNVRLSVNDPANDIQMRVGSLTAGISPIIRLQGRNTANSEQFFTDIELNAETGVLLLNDPGTSSSNIGENPVSIDSEGNLGIGTTNPTSTLEVSGQVLIKNTAPFLDFSDTNSFTDVNDRFRIRAQTDNGQVQWYDNSTTLVKTIMEYKPSGDVVIPNGKLGIGTTSTTAPLQVAGIAEYTNNTTALAAGLTAGAFYRTGDDLKVVH